MATPADPLHRFPLCARQCLSPLAKPTTGWVRGHVHPYFTLGSGLLLRLASDAVDVIIKSIGLLFITCIASWHCAQLLTICIAYMYTRRALVIGSCYGALWNCQCYYYRAMHCSAKRGIAIVYCLSVCPSVTIRYRDHVGWNSWKIIRPNRLGPVWGLTPTWAIWCNENTPKLGRNRGGVTRERKKPAISPKRCKIGPRSLWRTNRKSYRRFWLVPKSRPWVTLNGVSRDCPKFFKYWLLSQEQVKLRTSNLASTFTGSIRTTAH